jgi:hypothetical protein
VSGVFELLIPRSELGTGYEFLKLDHPLLLRTLEHQSVALQRFYKIVSFQGTHIYARWMLFEEMVDLLGVGVELIPQNQVAMIPSNEFIQDVGYEFWCTNGAVRTAALVRYLALVVVSNTVVSLRVVSWILTKLPHVVLG